MNEAQLREELAVACREPADAQTRHRERFRHDTERDASCRRLGARRQPVRVGELEVAVDLVDQEMHAGAVGDLDERVERRAVGQHPGRVVRRVHDDEPRLGRDLAAQQLDIDRPRGVLAELVEGHLGAGRAGDLVQALVARPRDDAYGHPVRT